MHKDNRIDGWVKFPRDIFQSKTWTRTNAFHVFAWCLFKANFKTGYINWKIGRGETTITVNPGQFVSGRFNGAHETGLTPSTWYREMQFLQREGLIDLKTNKHFTIVTICNSYNYDFQKPSSEQPNEQPLDKERTALGHLLDTI